MYSDKAFFLTKINQSEYDTVTGRSDANLIAAIETADSEIDSYLRSRFNSLPLANPTDKIRACSFHLAMKELYGRVAPNNVPDLVVKNSDDARNYLKDIAKGVVKLFPEVQSEEQEAFIYYDGFDTVMGRKG